MSSESRTDLKLEVVVLSVSDVDRAKRFYENLGWRLDADFSRGAAFRVVQFTPPGSACSIHFGIGLTATATAAASRLYLVVSDIVAARAELCARGAGVSEVVHRDGPGGAPIAGLDPKHRSYVSVASFADPDGNTWLLQEVTVRLPNRISAEGAAFTAATELAAALRRAEAAHTEHEKRTGTRDAHWSEWYARYLVAEQAGTTPPL